MVLCRQVNADAECQDIFEGDDKPFKCQATKKSCNCSKIFGCDHLKKKRARKFRCYSKRIQHLAQPKYVSQKYSAEETVNGKAAVEVIRTYEEQTPVRIKLLAYPKVRKLVSSREAYRNIVDKEWYDRFHELIQRSMLTMYSRMANVQLPDRSVCKKWTKADWQHHCEWLKKRAIPKVPKELPAMKRKKVPLNVLMASMFELSKPRNPRSKFHNRCGYKSSVKLATLSYKPTERVLKLAEPKHPKVEDDEEELEPFQVNPRALTFKPSKFLMS